MHFASSSYSICVDNALHVMHSRVMHEIDSIFKELGGVAEVGRLLGKRVEHASSMRRRKSIPVRYWPTLIEAAKAKGLDSVTYQTLVEAHAGRSAA